MNARIIVRARWLRLLAMAMLVNLVVGALCAHPRAAQAATTWWPDSSDVTADARATWVYFSGEFSANYSTEALVDAGVLEMRNKKIDTIIASFNPTDLDNLPSPTSPRTVLFQRLVDQAASYGMAVYVAYWEDEFSGSAAQMALYTEVDNVIAFNANNGTATDVVGVVSDFEMHENSTTHNRNTTRFNQWRQFHANLKTRIGTNNLKLVPVLNDPDVLIAACTDCTKNWKTSNGISGSNPFTGDVKFFTTYNTVRFASAYIGMYYYQYPSTIQSQAHDDIVEANALSPAAPVIVGFSVGPNFDPTLLTETEVNDAVSRIETERASYPNGVLGSMAWRWDDPADGDAEYRGVIASQPPTP